jgi:hypothetical protein
VSNSPCSQSSATTLATKSLVYSSNSEDVTARFRFSCRERGRLRTARRESPKRLSDRRVPELLLQSAFVLPHGLDLSAGRVVFECEGRRCAVEVRARTRTLYQELVVDLIAGSDDDLDEVGAAFRKALQEYDPARGQHLTFDKAGLRFMEPHGVTWDDVVLPEPTRDEIRRNVTAFLRAHQDGYAVPLPASRSL